MGTYYPDQLYASKILSDSLSDLSGSNDNPVTDVAIGTKLVIEFNYQCTNSTKNPVAGTFRCDWQDDTDTSGYSALGASGEITYTDIVGLTDGAVVTSPACTISGSYSYQQLCSEYCEDGVSGTQDLGTGECSVIRFAIDTTNADPTHQYSFRLYDTANTQEVGIAVATITMAAAVGDLSIGSGGTVYDAVSVDENIETALEDFINQYDEVTVDEAVETALENFVDNYDSISLDEDVTVTVFPADLSINVYDSVTVDDSCDGGAAIQYGDTDDWQFSILPDGSVLIIGDLTNADVIEFGLETPTGGDCAAIVEVQEASQDKNINVYDSITVDESATLFFENWVLSVYDSITVQENATVEKESATPLAINVYDSVTVDEDVTLEQTSFIDTYDSISVQENVTLLNTEFVSQYDTISINEDVTIEVAEAEPLSVNVFDSVGVAEDIETTQECFVDTYDSTTVSEYVEPVLTEFFVDVYDSISVDEYANTEREDKPPFLIDVFDSVSVAEYTEFDSTYFVDTYDSVGISEYTEFEGIYFIDSYDSVNVAEDRTVTIPAVSDLDIDVYDSIGVSEYVEFDSTYFINTYDSIGVSENVTFDGTYFIDSYDSISVAEDVTVDIVAIIPFSIDVYDSITVNENVSMATSAPLDLAINVYDTVSVAEYTTLTEVSFIDVYDSTSLSEDATVTTVEAAGLSISVYSGISLGEYVDLDVSIDIDVYDSTTLTEVATASAYTPPRLVSVYDSVNTSEYVSCIVSDCILDTYSGITVSEYVRVTVAFFGVSFGRISISTETYGTYVDAEECVDIDISSEEDPLIIEAIAC